MDTKQIKAYSKWQQVLIVDDEQTTTNVLEARLRELFKKIHKAKNGEEAYEIWEKNIDHIDLIISDIAMPKLNGVELVSKIRKSNSKVKIIMTSANSNSEHIIELANLGVDGFILKPIVFNSLFEQIYKATKATHEARSAESYKVGLERYIKFLTQKAHWALQLEKVLNNIIDIYTDEDMKKLAQTAKESNINISPMLQLYKLEKKRLNENIPKDLHTEVERQKDEYKAEESKKLFDKVSAQEYLDKIEFDKYFKDIYDEIYNLAEFASEIYDTLMFQDIDASVIRKTGKLYSNYGSILLEFSEFSALSSYVQSMGNFFQNLDVDIFLSKCNVKSFKDITVFFINDLESWKDAVFLRKDAVDIHYLDDQARSICEQTVGMLDEKDEDEDDDNNIILF